MNTAAKWPGLLAMASPLLDTPRTLELSSPKPVTFPTFADLSNEIPPIHAARSSQPTGLFEALLGRPEPLWQDAADHPASYEPQALALLSDLRASGLGTLALRGCPRASREPGAQRLERDRAILVLRARALSLDDHPGRRVPQLDRAVGLLQVLAARAAGATC